MKTLHIFRRGEGPKHSMRKHLQRALTASLLLCCLTLAAQEKGNWRAASNTARSITGDVALSDEKLFINFSGFTMSRIRSLEKPEISALFDADSTADGTAGLYRLNVPASKKFLHKNTLCGSDDTQWMVAYASGRTLQLAFFSGEKPPLLTLDAISNSTDLCGKYSYVK
jgi:hypothetical protein